MSIHRKIWKNHFGEIPKDADGRTYEIHHIDGNHQNNNITNLQCVSILEHYDIHYKQGDWGACQAILIRMKKDPLLISEMARLAGKRRAKEGTLNLLDGTIAKESARKRVKEGTHHFLGGEISRKTQQQRIHDGTHHCLGGEMQRRTQREIVASGKHHLQIKKVCPHCKKEGSGGGMYRFHFDNCKEKEINE